MRPLARRPARRARRKRESRILWFDRRLSNEPLASFGVARGVTGRIRQARVGAATRLKIVRTQKIGTIGSCCQTADAENNGRVCEFLPGLSNSRQLGIRQWQPVQGVAGAFFWRKVIAPKAFGAA